MCSSICRPAPPSRTNTGTTCDADPREIELRDKCAKRDKEQPVTTSSLTLPSSANVLLYQTEDGQTHLDVTLLNETVWLSLSQLTDLFQRDKSVISRHIKNVFDEGELTPVATVAFFATVQSEGERQVERQVAATSPDLLKSATSSALRNPHDG